MAWSISLASSLRFLLRDCMVRSPKMSASVMMISLRSLKRNPASRGEIEMPILVLSQRNASQLTTLEGLMSILRKSSVSVSLRPALLAQNKNRQSRFVDIKFLSCFSGGLVFLLMTTLGIVLV